MPDKDVPRPAPVFLRPRRPASRLAHGSLTWLLGLGVALLAMLLLTGENGLLRYLQLSNQRDELARERAGLEAEAAALEARLEALRTDPFALEKLARERYNMRREGEGVILLVPADPAAADSTKRP